MTVPPPARLIRELSLAVPTTSARLAHRHLYRTHYLLAKSKPVNPCATVGSQGGATGRDATAVSDEGVRSRRSFAPCNFRLPSRFSMTRTSSANTSQNRLSAAQSSDPTTTSNETETSWSSLPGLQSTQTPAVAAPALLTRASTTAGSDIGDDPPPTVTRIADRVRQWEQGETTQRYFI